MSDPIREALEAAKEFAQEVMDYRTPDTSSYCDRIRAVLKELTAAIALLDKPHPDTERLDRLSGDWGVIEMDTDLPGMGCKFGWNVWGGGDGKTPKDVRAAIDQARRANTKFDPAEPKTQKSIP